MNGPTPQGDRQRSRIVELMREDPNISLRSIAAKIDLSPTTVWLHVKKMTDDGIIDHGKCPTCGRSRWEVV